MKFALGQAVPRTEDPRLLTGRGRYTDDFVLPRLAHGYVLRSPHAHARIRSHRRPRRAADAGRACRPDRRRLGGGEIRRRSRPVIPRQRRDGSPMFVPPRPALAHGPRDAGRRSRSPLSSPRASISPRMRPSGSWSSTSRCPRSRRPRRRVCPTRRSCGQNAADNECFFYTLGDKRAVDAAFAKAASRHAAEARLQPQSPQRRWSRAAASATDDPARAATRSMSAPSVRTALAPTWRAAIFHIPETQLRVVAGDVGGSFGMKGGHFPEYALALWASRKARAAGQMDLPSAARAC